jgi:hypothetical protein
MLYKNGSISVDDRKNILSHCEYYLHQVSWGVIRLTVKVRKRARSRQRPRTPVKRLRDVVDRARKKFFFYFLKRT